VSRAADDAKPCSGVVYLDDSDPCLVRGEGTSFMSDFSPKMQVMLPKSLGSIAAEVIEVLSDTELKIKREFGGESGKGTSKIREKVEEARQAGQRGLPFRKLPFVDQEVMYRFVYDCLKEGGCIGIFPEGACAPTRS
jgi:glycerol-3-phosphate O-acyltransferase/dihydroxyacetone phosphate acyltransferase